MSGQCPQRTAASSGSPIVTPPLGTSDLKIPHALALLIIALAALPLYLICLGSGDANAMMEMFNLVPLREAFRDGHWLMPTLNGVPRLEKPPLAVWIPGGLTLLFHSDNLWIVRFPSAILGLMTCWATYGIGCLTSRDRRVGLFAAVALAAMLVFVRQARLASYDIYATAFITLGFLGLLAAVETRRLWWLWSILGGAAVGLAVLSKGPVFPAYVMLPFGIWLLIYHRKNPRMWLALAIGFVSSLVTFVPWLFAVSNQHEMARGAWTVWKDELFGYADASDENDTRWYYLAMLVWVFPWTPALVAGLVLPFLPSKSDPSLTEQERRARWLFWLVLILGLVLLTIPHDKKQRYALQQFPFAALLVGIVWQEFCRLRSSEPIDTAAKIFLAIQSLLFTIIGLLIAILIPLVLFAQPAPTWQDTHWTLSEGLAALQSGLAVLGPVGWAVVAIVMIVLGVLLWRWQFGRRFDRAFAAYAVGGWLLMLGITWAYFGGTGYQDSEFKVPSQELVQAAGGAPIYCFTDDSPWLPVLYYANRDFPQTDLSLAKNAATQSSPIYVLTRDESPWIERLGLISMATHRDIRVIDRVDDGHYRQTLFELVPAKSNN
jgi:4-amino-4-deoxy-L-arabinose transferase-like glycosyltransferase